MTFNPTDNDTANLREWEEGEWWARLAEVLGVDEIDGDGDPQSLLIDHVAQAMGAAFEAGRFLGHLESPLYDRDTICQRAGHPIVTDERDPHFGGARIRTCTCGSREDDATYEPITIADKIAALDKLDEAARRTRP
jgi:hypothetical protein